MLFSQNHCVERIWVEVNSRVNYPIKTCLLDLEERGDLDMECNHVKFCVSWFAIRVASICTTLAVNSWNDHPIPGPHILISCVILFVNVCTKQQTSVCHIQVYLNYCTHAFKRNVSGIPYIEHSIRHAMLPEGILFSLMYRSSQRSP